MSQVRFYEDADDDEAKFFAKSLAAGWKTPASRMSLDECRGLMERAGLRCDSLKLSGDKASMLWASIHEMGHALVSHTLGVPFVHVQVRPTAGVKLGEWQGPVRAELDRRGRGSRHRRYLVGHVPRPVATATAAADLRSTPGRGRAS